MATKLKSGKADADTYLDLIRRFPLKPIKDDAAHARAVELIGELLDRTRDTGAGDYLDTLILLVNTYEDQHHTPLGLDLTPREALRAIMDANNLTQVEIGRIIGSESAVSMFLNGQRALSKRQIKALAERFRIDASLFL